MNKVCGILLDDAADGIAVPVGLVPYGDAAPEGLDTETVFEGLLTSVPLMLALGLYGLG